jgi:hypothetical protein
MPPRQMVTNILSDLVLLSSLYRFYPNIVKITEEELGGVLRFCQPDLHRKNSLMK